MEALGALTVTPSTVTVIGALGSLPSASATTVTVSPSDNSGTVASQLPSSSASAVIGSPSGSVIVTVAPGSAVPLTVVSPAVTGLIVGVSVNFSTSSAGTTSGVPVLR